VRFFLISDNVDTQAGLRLAGIEGTLAHELGEFTAAMDRAVADPGVGIVLVTQKLGELYPGVLLKYKQQYMRPIIIEVPDRHGLKDVNTIEQYVQAAIGVIL